MVVPTTRCASTPLPVSHLRKLGKVRLMTKAKISTNMGRLEKMADTRDTGPFYIATNSSTTPTTTINSLKASSPRTAPRRLRPTSSLMT